MKIYRLTKTQYVKDLEGTGAKLFGGRWNHINTPCIYTAESRALALLEYSVNASIDFIPRALSVCIFKIDPQHIKHLQEEDLPGNWRTIPAPKSTRDLGTHWLQKGVAILKIPSLVIPSEYNYLLNPLAEVKAFELLEVQDFVYDVRIKQNP